MYYSLPFTAQNSANADFADFDAFGQSSGSSNFKVSPQQVTLLFSPKPQVEPLQHYD